MESRKELTGPHRDLAAVSSTCKAGHDEAMKPGSGARPRACRKGLLLGGLENVGHYHTSGLRRAKFPAAVKASGPSL